jgi:20S proteasome subunit beta 7
MVDLIGTMFEDDVIATAFGTHLCLPLMRKAGSDLSKEEATKVMEDCLRVLFYRNTKSSTRVRSDPPSFPFPSILCDTPS